MKVASPVLNGGREDTYSNATRLAPTQLPRSRFQPQLRPSVRVSAGTSRHSGEGCKSQTGKVQPTPLAPSHAQASVTAWAKR
jgi:hypothetical protein